MICDLGVPFVDARADALSFSLDAVRHPALSTTFLQIGPVALELRILGSSHQAIATTGDDALCETVACLPAAVDGVPTRHVTRCGLLLYSFRSEVEHLEPAALRLRAAALRDRAAREEHVVAGVFPGAPEALTVLAAAPLPGGARWESFHVYPQSGEIVSTSSRVVVG